MSAFFFAPFAIVLTLAVFVFIKLSLNPKRPEEPTALELEELGFTEPTEVLNPPGPRYF